MLKHIGRFNNVVVMLSVVSAYYVAEQRAYIAIPLFK